MTFLRIRCTVSALYACGRHALKGLRYSRFGLFAYTLSRKCSTTTGQNIDQAEVDKFSQLASQWWDPEGWMKPLHKLNPKRIAYLRTYISAHYQRNPFEAEPLKGLTIVDVGCGAGLLTEPLARLGANVIGLDAAEENIKAAQRHLELTDPKLHASNRIEYVHTTVEELFHQRGSFADVVCSMEVIEHVPNVQLFLHACGVLVKPNGALFLSTINRTLKSFALAIICAEYILGWVPKGTHQWTRFVQPAELALVLQQPELGYEIKEVTGLSYNIFQGKWEYSKHPDVNYQLYAARTKLQQIPKAEPNAQSSNQQQAAVTK